MLNIHEQNRVHDLLESGLTTKEVSRRTNKSLGTIYKYKRLGRTIQRWGSLSEGEKIPNELLPFEALLDSYLARRKVNLTELFFAIQQQGFQGSHHLFNRYVRRRRQELQPARQLQHVETLPGAQAQVDWGHFGELSIGGRREKVYLFSYVLSWSRAMYMEFVVRQNQRTLQACHMRAFEKLGVPQTIIYDNMKTVVTRREKLPDGSKKIHYNVNFLDFARYYQFEPIACPPYWPQAKGKVEASIKYARNYFVRCRPNVNTTLEQLNSNLKKWLDEHAQQRIHGSTGEQPIERWLQEKPFLAFPTNMPPYQASTLRIYHTTQYGLLNHGGITYQLGQAFALLKLEVREVDDHGLPLLEIYRNSELIATVPVPTKKHSWVTVFDDKKKHPPAAQPTPKQKQPKPYDITVAARDLDYYGIAVASAEGGLA